MLPGVLVALTLAVLLFVAARNWALRSLSRARYERRHERLAGPRPGARLPQ
jgi:hypothetical protein